jgi:hypothetical protein
MLKMQFFQSGKLITEQEWQSITTEEMKTGSKGWLNISGKADLTPFKPGIYEMRISVKDNKSKISAQRTAIFGIE